MRESPVAVPRRWVSSITFSSRCGTAHFRAAAPCQGVFDVLSHRLRKTALDRDAAIRRAPLLEHVIEETQARGDGDRRFPIERHRDSNVRFARLPLDRRAACDSRIRRHTSARSHRPARSDARGRSRRPDLRDSASVSRSPIMMLVARSMLLRARNC